MGDAFGAIANFGGAVIADRRAGIEGRRAENSQRDALNASYPVELQNLRRDYYSSMAGFAPQVVSGGYGNYGNYNPYQGGQSPFARYGGQQPYSDQQRQINSPYGNKNIRSDYSGEVGGGSGTTDAGEFTYTDPEAGLRNETNSFGGLGADGYARNAGLTIGTGLGDQGMSSAPTRDNQNYINGRPNVQGQLELLNQAGQVNFDPRIDQMLGQQGQGIQNNQPLNMANLQQLQQQLGMINQGSQNGLQDLINQSQGNNQNIQSLFNQQAGQQGQNNPQAQAYQNLLGLSQSFAQGQQNTGNFDQFTGAIGGALGNNQQNINGIDQQTQQLIDANNATSDFEQQKAIQDLNDQLSARGLSNSQAGTEAIASAQAQFSRQRATDQARIRQEALNNSFNQRLQGNNLQGSLASQGANVLSQQGQLGNADLNARLRALDTSGQFVQGQGNQQSQGIGNLLQLLNANQQGIGNVNGLQNQASQQNAGFAQANYGLNQQGINMNNDTLAQLVALYSQNEQRNQGIGQQAFANRGALFDRGNAMLTNALNGAQQGAIQASSINANQAQNQFASSNANRQASGQMLGQAFEHLNNAYQDNRGQGGFGGGQYQYGQGGQNIMNTPSAPRYQPQQNYQINPNDYNTNDASNSYFGGMS